MRLLILSLLLILSIGVVSGVTLDDAKQYFSFDEGGYTGTTVIDASGNTNGTSSNVNENKTGVLKEAFEFIGSSYVDTNIGYDNEFTANIWVYLTPETKGTAILGVRNPSGAAGTRGLQMQHLANGSINVQFYTVSNGNAGVLASPDLGYGWNYISLQRNLNNAELFINASSVSTDSTTGKYIPPHDMYIGQLGEQTIQNYLNRTDEWSYYDRILNQSELNALFNGGTGFNPYDVVQYFEITANDSVTSSQILSFSAVVNGTLFTTVNGTIVTTIPRGDTLNITITSSGYQTYTVLYDTSSNLNALLTPIEEADVRTQIFIILLLLTFSVGLMGIGWQRKATYTYAAGVLLLLFLLVQFISDTYSILEPFRTEMIIFLTIISALAISVLLGDDL